MDLRNEREAQHGAGLALLTEPTTSPTFLRAVHAFLDRFPAARWYQHTPLGRHDLEGIQLDYRFENADVIFSIGSDFLYRHPAALRYCRAFTDRRRVVNGTVTANRFYAIEVTPSVTGTMADQRLPVSPERITILLSAISRALGVNGPSQTQLPPLTTDEQAFV